MHRSLQNKIRFLAGATVWFFLVAPAGARLNPQYQMALGNPDGASTNTASRTKFLINKRAQYVISYNDDTHQANWVGWSYSLADDGSQARTDAWAKEELLPSGYLQIGTATFGTGWDRGHMCPSADRTKDLTNNQVTFRMSNIIPQASQNNQGLWANFEDYCRTLAANNNEIVIISGPAQFTGSRLGNQMSVPGSVWKIAVIVSNATSATPANERIATSARVIALLTPNTSTGLGPWQSYITSVEHIEDVTGFNFFTAITNQNTAIYLKNLVDTGSAPNSPTVITTFNPTLGAAGTSVAISGYNFGSSPVVQFNGLQASATTNSNGITATVPAGATSGYITVQGPGGTDISYEPFTVSATVSPTLSLTPGSLSGLTADQGSAGTPAAYALTGSNLTNSVTVTAPANFEVSKDGGSTFGDAQTIGVDITGALSMQLYARIKAGAAAGNVSGTIAHSSGASTANLAVSGAVGALTPALTVSPNSLTGFSALQNAAGTSKSYNVSGVNLTGSISIAAPAGFEVSTDNASFGTSRSLAPSAGALGSTTVYVRLAASGTAGAVSGTITHSGGGAPAQDVTVAGSVTSTAPSLVLSTNSISGFTAVQNSPGGSKAYTVSGTFLTGSVTLGASTGFEIGTNTTTFGSSLALSPASGTLASTTIYARLAASPTTGAKSGSITQTGGGASQQDVTVSGTVNAATSGGTTNTLARWTFESFSSGTTGTTLAAYSPEAGVQTNSAALSGLHASASTAYTNFAGNGSTKGLSANNWSTNDYFQFKVNMAGYQDLKMRFDQTGSGTGPAQFRVAYSTNGISFASFTNYDVPKNGTSTISWSTSSSNALSTVLLDMSAIADLNNSSDVYLRILPRSTVSLTNGTVGTGGTSRIDNVIVEATTVGAPAGLKPVVTSAPNATATAYSPFSYQITASNSPTYFSASGLPAGLSVDNTTGIISGTPTNPGTFSVILTASNDNGDGTKTFTLTVAPRPVPVITSATTATAAVNAPFQYQITASNSPTGFDATGLPAGLTVDNTTGIISGTPTATGNNSVTLSASNASGTGTAALSLTVNPDPNAPVISGPFTATAAVDVPFTYQITANNAPTAYLANNLPAGLSIDPASGAISGTPVSAGASAVVITAINAFGSDTKTLTITVLTPAIQVSPSDLAFSTTLGVASQPQTYVLTGTDIASPLTVLAPENFEVSENGTGYVDELTVAPAPDRTVNITISVRMKSSAPLGESGGGIIHVGADTLPKYINLVGFSDVAAATMELSTSSLTAFSTKTGTASFVQSYNLTGAGLTANVVVAAPTGYQVSADNTTFSSAITVSPEVNGNIAAKEIFVRLLSATAGTFNGSISHIGGGAEDRYLAVSGTVAAPIGPPIVSFLSGSGYTNATFSNKITAGGSLLVTSYGASNLPAGLTVNATNGVVSGKVAASGTYTFQVSASTQDGTTTTNYTLRVLSASEQNAIPLGVVINKYQNGFQSSSPDRVELLVTGSTNDAAPGPPVDLRGVILRDFENSMGTDTGGKYQLGTNALWSSVKAGTLIVLSAGTSSPETQLDPGSTQGTNWVLNVNLGNTAYFNHLGGVFDILDTEMVMLKPGNMGIEGVAGGIHAIAGGATSTQFTSYTGKKIWSETPLSGSKTYIYAINDSSSLSDYSLGTNGAAAGRSLTFGEGNSLKNTTFISNLRATDQTPPVVTLVGSATVNLVVGQTYAEQGATVSGGISSTASVSGSVNTSVAGPYTITYSASDSAGNVGTVTRMVIVAKATSSITQAPTASAIIAGQKLSASTLTGGSASVPGTFAWSNPNQVVSTASTADYEVTFAPTDAANYDSATAMVSVTANQGTAFESWMTSYDLAGANVQSSADPDRDGLSNALEFDLGRNPTRGDGWVRGITAGSGQMKITYLQRIGASFTVQSTTDVASGFTSTVTPVLSAPQPGDIPSGYEQYEATVTGPGGRAFLRILSVQP
ncbi:MAG: DNA/RNA non-specific endonuclease [Chthoniobacterales bacterium]|nr:DNA/RNA non-specific endonuclease [Chthoniobacterales bacterium]